MDTTGPVCLLDILPGGASPSGTGDASMAFPEGFGLGTVQRFTLSPSLLVMLHQYTLTRDVRLRRRAERGDQSIVTFSFRNIIRPVGGPTATLGLLQPVGPLPTVQVSSGDIDLDLYFPAHTRIDTIIIGIDRAMLNQLMGPKAENPLLKTLPGARQSYLYEEIGSLAVQQIATDIMDRNPADPLLNFYLTIKAQALIYQFMSELLTRDMTLVYPLRDDEVKRLFGVRARLVLDLSHSPAMPQLAQLAGMSESKLRRLFRQVFGLSLYDYYQTVRMHEAARLLREARLSVSETGYRLGFTNLSHFTRIFAKHLGQNPKQYAKGG